MSSFHRWVNSTLVNKDGPVAGDCLENKQIVVLFFGSDGPQLAGAVQQITQLYTTLKQSPQADEFEIVYVHSEAGGNQASFDQAFNGQAWLAIPFSEAALRAKLTAAHEPNLNEGFGLEIMAKDCTVIPQMGEEGPLPTAFNPTGGVPLLDEWKTAAAPGNIDSLDGLSNGFNTVAA